MVGTRIKKKAIIVVVACMAILALAAGVAFAAVHTGIAGSGSDATCTQENGTCEQDCGGPRGRGPGKHHEEIHATIAETLGISTEELEEELSGDKTLAQLAEEKGISSEQLVEAVVNRVNELVDEDLAKGDLTEEQAEEIKSHTAERAQNMIERAPGPRGRGEDHGPDAMREHRDEVHAAVAEVLGISTEELEEELSSGKTKAQIAEEKGVSTDHLVEVITNKINEITDRELAEGNLTEDQAEEIRSRTAERVQDMVERAPGEHGRGGPHGPEGRPDGGSEAQDNSEV